MGKVLLVVLTKPVAGREDEYNEWYSGRHLDDILRMEGFTAAQRFEFVPSELSDDAPFPYLAIYEAEEGSRERAEAALLSATKEQMPISKAMDRDNLKWWFASIGDRVEAPQSS